MGRVLSYALFSFMLVLTVELARYIWLQGDSVAALTNDFGQHVATLSLALVLLVLGDVILGVMLFQELRRR